MIRSFRVFHVSIKPGATHTEGFDHPTLRPNWVRWLNAVTWTNAPTYIVGHSDEAAALSAERTTNEVERAITLRNGSFQGITDKYLFGEV
ncbi:hypothetical protein AB0M29_38970 [Streptomyces sp. NPDC051976]|uniref:hypothetical protein n=1 Tax=Streptomyces sp. NPDC051976 TaxID=3154947 RepID=UPI003441DFF1